MWSGARILMAGSEASTWKCRRCCRSSHSALTSLSASDAALRVRAATNRFHGANSPHSADSLNERQPYLGGVGQGREMRKCYFILIATPPRTAASIQQQKNNYGGAEMEGHPMPSAK